VKRTDRLYALMDLLKDGRLYRAEDLAARLSVSVRTIYRDMDTLVEAGVPVEGTRGAGYTARAAITLPPLNLTEEELGALHVGLAAVGAGGEAALAAAAHSLSAKIDAVLPEDHTAPRGAFGFSPHVARAALGFRHMPRLRDAIRARQRLALTLDDGAPAHEVRPLALDYWGRVWSCVVWDETRGAFARLRVDRITEARPLPGLFVDEPGKTLRDFRAAEGR